MTLQVSKPVSEVTVDIDSTERPPGAIDGGLEVVVLIVAFNGIEYLPECLDSVLASDDGPIARRVVVLHEGSVIAEGDMDKVQQDARVIEVYLGV